MMTTGIINEKGFTLIELLIVIVIIGVLASIAIPQFNQYKARSYNADSKANLHNVYIACKAFWLDEGSQRACTGSMVATTTYGFIQSSNVTISGAGNETAFSSTAIHSSSTRTFTIDANGNIT